MKSYEIRQRFLDFFAQKDRDHVILDSAPLIPDSDGGDRNVTLFNVAGMQPLMPYLLGEDHPEGKRLANSQKCLRTVDIDEVGDNTHATFFEMLGNWSLGDYFKEKAIKWSYEFLTDKEEGLGLDKDRLYVTVFAGNDIVPRDEESKEIWMSLGIPENRIYYRDSKDNWWTAGPDSPAGPSTEMFYDLTDEGLGDLSPEAFEQADEEQKVVEIWNDVFMAYKQKPRTVLVDAVHCLVDADGAVNKELHNYLRALPHQIIVVTNASQEKHADLFGNVHYPVFSLYGEPRKEESLFFEKLLETYQLSAEDVIYFDHSEDNIKSAESVGIRSELYTSNKDAISFIKKYGIRINDLSRKNVDTGSGLERLTAVVQKKKSIFETDLYEPILWKIYKSGFHQTELERKDFVRKLGPAEKIVADHVKASVMLIVEDLEPSNSDRGYILRRLIRRAHINLYRAGYSISLSELADVVIDLYKDFYQNLETKKSQIKATLDKEVESFEKTLEKGLKEFEKGERDAFVLFTTYGFPLEMTIELAKEKSEEIDIDDFHKKMTEHQEKSRRGAQQKFKGGLADADNSEVVKLHTAHHLLLAALQQVLGHDVKQRGSNITPERLRIDFTFDRKMTPEEKEQVEKIVNEKISENLPVIKKEMPREEAEKIGAEMEFGQKYPDVVNVYFVGEPENAFSKEFCGGPHVENTGELGSFKIKKEESSSAGVRRIKAVLG